MDEHVPRAITEGLKIRGIDVLTVQEDGLRGISDKELLDRANLLGRVLFSQARRRQGNNEFFSGLIYAHPLKITIGRCIEELELLAKILEPEDFYNQIIFLPLK
jgi:hypothetical protein